MAKIPQSAPFLADDETRRLAELDWELLTDARQAGRDLGFTSKVADAALPEWVRQRNAPIP